MNTSGNGHLFQVRMSELVRAQFKRLKIEAIQQGQEGSFISAVRALHDRLQKDPTGFGQPLFSLPALDMVVYIATVYPLVVQYGVHGQKPLVVIRYARAYSS